MYMFRARAKRKGRKQINTKKALKGIIHPPTSEKKPNEESKITTSVVVKGRSTLQQAQALLACMASGGRKKEKG